MSPDVCVVVPVRNGAPVLEWSLPPLVAQAAALGGHVIVVDDASDDDTASVAARLGAEVLDAPGRGPYVARNIGWRSSDAEVIAFTDARCQPQDGWAERLTSPLHDSDLALVGGRSIIEEGPELGRRVAARLDPYELPYHLNHHRLPYFPTANLAATREALERVGGFDEVRSGGDAALCWDVQGAGFRAAAVREAVVLVRARATLREVLAQYRRYGRSSRRLARSRDEAVPPRLLHGLAFRGRDVLGALRHPLASDWSVELSMGLVQLAFTLGYLTEPVSPGGAATSDDT